MIKTSKLVLFDVDYTLIMGSKAHKIAIVEGIKEIFNINVQIDRLSLPGMTDQQIITDLLEISGVEKNIIKKNMNKCLKSIIKSYNIHKSQDTIELMEGVKPLLDMLSKYDTIILGLVTGNIEPIAYGKLSSVGIDNYFKVGGFGSDHIERYKLVEIAIERAKKMYKVDILSSFVIGDTPKDVTAAKKAGAYSIAVSSGSYNKNELKKTGADLVLKSLLEKEKLINFINSK